MIASLSLAGIGVLFLVLFGVFYYLAIFATIRALLAFLGVILVGTAGFVGGALSAAGSWLSHISTTLTGWLFGIPVLPAVTIIVLSIFMYDLWPKHTAGKRTGWAGVLLAALIVAGATGIPALNSVGTAIQGGVTSARHIVGG